MGFKFIELWGYFVDYPSTLQYWIVKEKETGHFEYKTGHIEFKDDLDEFAEKYGEYIVTDFSIFNHNGGFALNVYLRSDN